MKWTSSWPFVLALALMLPACSGLPDAQLLSLLTVDGECVADPGAMAAAGEFLDVGATNARLMAPVAVANTADASKGSKRDFIVERAVLSYSSPQADLDATLQGLGTREVPLGVVLEAGQNTGIWIELIPRDVASLLAADPALSTPTDRVSVTVDAHLEGARLNGKSAESDTFSFPVEVCNGCNFCPDGSEPLWGCSEGRGPATCL